MVDCPCAALRPTPTIAQLSTLWDGNLGCLQAIANYHLPTIAHRRAIPNFGEQCLCNRRVQVGPSSAHQRATIDLGRLPCAALRPPPTIAQLSTLWDRNVGRLQTIAHRRVTPNFGEQIASCATFDRRYMNSRPGTAHPARFRSTAYPFAFHLWSPTPAS